MGVKDREPGHWKQEGSPPTALCWSASLSPVTSQPVCPSFEHKERVQRTSDRMQHGHLGLLPSIPASGTCPLQSSHPKHSRGNSWPRVPTPVNSPQPAEWSQSPLAHPTWPQNPACSLLPSKHPSLQPLCPASHTHTSLRLFRPLSRPCPCLPRRGQGSPAPAEL